jgi:hypothetical protein
VGRHPSVSRINPRRPFARARRRLSRKLTHSPCPQTRFALSDSGAAPTPPRPACSLYPSPRSIERSVGSPDTPSGPRRISPSRIGSTSIPRPGPWLRSPPSSWLLLMMRLMTFPPPHLHDRAGTCVKIKKARGHSPLADTVETARNSFTPFSSTCDGERSPLLRSCRQKE